jgi:hypothetical protein
MKIFSPVSKALVLGASLSLFLSAAAHAEKPFALRVGGNDTLYVYDLQGNVVATLPTGTIAKQMDVGSYSFQVSYGRDASGNLSVIVTPSDGNTTPLDFTLNGRDISVSQDGVATMTLNPNGQVQVEGGSLGGVKVDGQSSNAQVAASPAPLPGAGVSPAANTPDAIVAQFAPAPALLPGPTNQKPDVLPSDPSASYGAEGALDPSQIPSARPVTTDVRTNPSALVIPTNPPATTPI